VILAIAAAALVAGSGHVQAAPQPIVTIVRRGGLCAAATECRSVVRISDSTISGQGYVSRPLARSARIGLVRAIGRLDEAYLRAHPFTGVCPTVYDAAETIYRFRGFAHVLPSCTYDLRSVQAVELTDRLLATLTFERRTSP
jgi:hypothetical protein